MNSDDLPKEEFESLKSHFATSSSWGGRRTRPYVFTEQGIAMHPVFETVIVLLGSEAG